MTRACVLGSGGWPPPSPHRCVLCAVRQRVLDRRVHELEWGQRGRLALLVTELPADGHAAQVRRGPGGEGGVGERGRR